jgi:hypothetical protein
MQEVKNDQEIKKSGLGAHYQRNPPDSGVCCNNTQDQGCQIKLKSNRIWLLNLIFFA